MTRPSEAASVVHVNDVAAVGSTLVSLAAERGLAWELRRIPAGRGAAPPVVAARRARDLATWLWQRRRFDLLHLHYGVTGYYGAATRSPVVLHLHGTDVRVDRHSRVLGPVVRRAIDRADAVIYATADLADAVQELRPDAIHLPNALPRLYAEPAAPPPQRSRARVVFNMRWDDAKGGAALVAAARELTELADVVGVDWGTHAAAARAAGVQLVPLLDAVGFRELLASADVVVGQQRIGSLGLADLQAMAVGRPVVVRCLRPGVPVAYSEPATAVEVAAALLAEADRAAALGAQGRAWALTHHDGDRVLDQLLALYDRLLEAR